MNTFIRVMIVIGLIAVIGTVISTIVSDPLGNSIHSSFIFFLSTIHALDNLLPTATIFICLAIIANYWITEALVELVFYLVKLISGS